MVLLQVLDAIVLCLGWSSDGSTMALGRADGCIALRNADGVPLSLVDATPGVPVTSLAWAPTRCTPASRRRQLVPCTQLFAVMQPNCTAIGIQVCSILYFERSWPAPDAVKESRHRGSQHVEATAPLRCCAHPALAASSPALASPLAASASLAQVLCDILQLEPMHMICLIMMIRFSPMSTCFGTVGDLILICGNSGHAQLYSRDGMPLGMVASSPGGLASVVRALELFAALSPHLPSITNLLVVSIQAASPDGVTFAAACEDGSVAVHTLQFAPLQCSFDSRFAHRCVACHCIVPLPCSSNRFDRP